MLIFADKYKKIGEMARFKRILFKLSGESLHGSKGYGIDETRLAEYAQQIQEIKESIANPIACK